MDESARLRAAAMRLAAELDSAGFPVAAAHAGMAVDALVRAAGAEAPDLRTDVETEFELDEHGRVWMIREGDCWITGRKGAVCAEMRRFLSAAVLGGDSYS